MIFFSIYLTQSNDSKPKPVETKKEDIVPRAEEVPKGKLPVYASLILSGIPAAVENLCGATIL